MRSTKNLIQLTTDLHVGPSLSGIDLPGLRRARPDKFTARNSILLYSGLGRVDNRRVGGKYRRQSNIQSAEALDGDIGDSRLKGLAEGQGLR